MGLLNSGFMQIQIIIFLSIVISSLIGGKKIALLAVLVWGIETFIVYRQSNYNFLQVITVVFSFQIGMILGIARDSIIKRTKKKKQEIGNN